MSKSQSHSDTVLDLVAAGHYVALYASAPPSDDSGPGTELSGNGYARQVFNPGAKSTDADGHTRKFSNGSTVVFAPASATWSEATPFGIVSASTGGTVKYTGQLQTPKTVQSGGRPYGEFSDALVFTPDEYASVTADQL